LLVSTHLPEHGEELRAECRLCGAVVVSLYQPDHGEGVIYVLEEVLPVSQPDRDVVPEEVDGFFVLPEQQREGVAQALTDRERPAVDLRVT